MQVTCRLAQRENDEGVVGVPGLESGPGSLIGCFASHYAILLSHIVGAMCWQRLTRDCMLLPACSRVWPVFRPHGRFPACNSVTHLSRGLCCRWPARPRLCARWRVGGYFIPPPVRQRTGLCLVGSPGIEPDQLDGIGFTDRSASLAEYHPVCWKYRLHKSQEPGPLSHVRAPGLEP